MFLRFSAFLFLLCVPLSPAYAAEDPADPVKAQNEALQSRVAGLMQTLTADQARHFMVMYANYNIYSMVQAVRADIGRAVEACAENNADMADTLHNKFDTWKKSVGDTMEEADANIQNLALAQTYIPESDLKALFKQVDDVRALNSSRFEKIPVTTPEACEFMLSKMDETQDNMNKMLRATLISYPNMLQKTQE